MYQCSTGHKKRTAGQFFGVQSDHVHNDYKDTREFINLLFEKKIIKEVIFKIQDSHVNCTIDFDPKYLEFPKIFMQDSTSCQSSAGGKTEQEAFFSALSKITFFT